MMKRLGIVLVMACIAAGSAAAAPAPAGITLSNYAEIGDTVVDMLNTSGLAFSTLVLGANDRARVRHAAFSPPPPIPQTEPFDLPCPGGGSLSGSMSDRDASGDVSVRDRFVTVFKACRVDNDVVSGSSEFTVTMHRFDGTTEITELEFRFKELGTDTLRWSGPATVTLRSDRRNGSEHYVVRYHDLSVARGTRHTRWNFRLEMNRPPIGDHTARIDGAMTVGGLPLKLVQDEPFVLAPDGTPRSGRLTASDGAGDRVQVDAGARHYRYRYFNRGNRGELPDASSPAQNPR